MSFSKRNKISLPISSIGKSCWLNPSSVGFPTTTNDKVSMSVEGSRPNLTGISSYWSKDCQESIELTILKVSPIVGNDLRGSCSWIWMCCIYAYVGKFIYTSGYLAGHKQRVFWASRSGHGQVCLCVWLVCCATVCLPTLHLLGMSHPIHRRNSLSCTELGLPWFWHSKPFTFLILFLVFLD